MMTVIEQRLYESAIHFFNTMTHKAEKQDKQAQRNEIATSVISAIAGSNPALGAEEAAKAAVKYADALIAELGK